MCHNPSPEYCLPNLLANYCTTRGAKSWTITSSQNTSLFSRVTKKQKQIGHVQDDREPIGYKKNTSLFSHVAKKVEPSCSNPEEVILLSTCRYCNIKSISRWEFLDIVNTIRYSAIVQPIENTRHLHASRDGRWSYECIQGKVGLAQWKKRN